MDENCQECIKIKCRGCGWEANVEEEKLIKNGKLTRCPVCAWSPKTTI